MGTTMAVVSKVHKSVHQSASASTFPPTVKHNEADTRIFIYLLDMVTNGITKIGIRTVDTDVLVLVLASFNKLHAIGLREQWLLFRTDKNIEIFLYIKLLLKLVPKCAQLFLASTCIVGVTLCLSLLAEGRKQSGKRSSCDGIHQYIYCIPFVI